MRKKKINAFTLVELLAVIVILAIILVIVVPRITKVIEQSKKGALESSAKLIAGSLETKYKEELALGTDDISTSTSKTCPASMYDSTLYSCTYTLDSDTGKATVSLIGKTDSKFEDLGVDSTTTEAISYKLGEPITITFDSQDGSEVSALSLTSGDVYGTLPTPTKSGVAFKGWYTEATGGTKIMSTDIAKSSITLYAYYAVPVELSNTWENTISGKTVDTLTISTGNIGSLKFYDNSDNIYDTTGKVFIANVSTTGETIKAYGEVDSTNSARINIDIVGDSIITFPQDSNYLFYDLRGLNKLDFNNSIITSNVISMNCMFGWCQSLNTLDLNVFDTSNVTDMGRMFMNCSSTSINLSSFDTSKVTNMALMFAGCSYLKKIDVSDFDTSNVTSMASMFSGCRSLINLDLSNFDTSKVTSMNSMFISCSSLTSLNISSFNTSNVTDMSYMFYGCSKLTSLTIPATNGNGINNETTKIYGSTTDVVYDFSSLGINATLK